MKLLALLFVCLALPAWGHAEWKWMMQNANPAIRACCGKDDCHPIAIDAITDQEDGSAIVRFIVNGVAYYTAVKPQNIRDVPVDVDTDHGWVCVYMTLLNNAEPGAIIPGRCLFRPPSMF